MRLRHFLHGKSPLTDDFLTLVKSSEITESELKYWESRVNALMRELRDVGVPGEDFLRLFLSKQGKDKDKGEWAYVRARTGGDRSRFDFQAVILSAADLDQLFWQPWVLDGALFDGNTRDPRVQEAMRQDASPRSGREREYNPPIVNVEFDGEARRPRLNPEQRKTVDRLVTSLGSPVPAETRWYFDEGQVGEEGARNIIASLLNRMHDLNGPVPGFVMGLASVRDNNQSMGAAYRNDARFSDIRLASYKKEASGSFPFENWRDAALEQPAAESRRTGSLATGHGDGLSAPLTQPQGNATTAPRGRTGQLNGSTRAGQSAGAPAEPAPYTEGETRRTTQPESDDQDETPGPTPAQPDPVESIQPPAPEPSPSGQFPGAVSRLAAADSASRTDAPPNSSTGAETKRPRAKRASVAPPNNFLGNVRDNLERPLPLKVTLLVALGILIALGGLSYINNRAYRTQSRAAADSLLRYQEEAQNHAVLKEEYLAYKASHPLKIDSGSVVAAMAPANAQERLTIEDLRGALAEISRQYQEYRETHPDRSSTGTDDLKRRLENSERERRELTVKAENLNSQLQTERARNNSAAAGGDRGAADDLRKVTDERDALRRRVDELQRQIASSAGRAARSEDSSQVAELKAKIQELEKIKRELNERIDYYVRQTREKKK